MMVNAIGYTLFMTSQYDVILMFGEVCWHSVHNILHALSLLVIVAYGCHCKAHKLISALSEKTGAKHSTQPWDRAVQNCKNIQQRVKTGR